MNLSDTDKLIATMAPEPTPDQKRHAQEVIAAWALTQDDPTAELREMLAAFGLYKEV